MLCRLEYYDLTRRFFFIFVSLQVQWPVSSAAKNGKLVSRVETLSRPKERKEGPYCDPEWRVSKSAQNAQASSRVQVINCCYCFSVF